MEKSTSPTGGSAKMTPSPPMPKLRSHMRAACSGVTLGSAESRLSTCASANQQPQRAVALRLAAGRRALANAANAHVANRLHPFPPRPIPPDQISTPPPRASLSSRLTASEESRHYYEPHQDEVVPEALVLMECDRAADGGGHGDRAPRMAGHPRTRTRTPRRDAATARVGRNMHSCAALHGLFARWDCAAGQRRPRGQRWSL
eukprot:363563-Chlamydomonas_euryale.AAC.3